MRGKVNNKASALMISLWILAILTMLTVGIGHRVSMALRLSRYESERLKASYLAKAGINRATVELEKDTNSFDALNEPWANNPEIFEKITINENPAQFATVSYTIEENGRKETKFGVIDEESKININTASKELLLALLEKYGISDAEKVSDNIRAWRGDAGVAIPDYQDLGYVNKSAKFSQIEELILVKDVKPEGYNLLSELITVYGAGKININTTSDMVLEIIIDSCVKKLENEGVEERDPQDLVSRITELRLANAVFESIGDLKVKLESQKSLTSAQNNILNKLPEEANTKSACFSIPSSGKINKIDYLITAVYDRDKKKIIYWHES